MLVAQEMVIFPGILLWNRVEDELGLSEDRYKVLYAKCVDNSDLKLKGQTDYLRHICKNDDEYFAALLISGVTTQFYVSDSKKKKTLISYFKQREKGLNFKDIENFDNVVDQFGLTPPRLSEIFKAYNETIKGRNPQKMGLQTQIKIMSLVCANINELTICLINVGMYTWNWYVVNNQVHGTDIK